MKFSALHAAMLRLADRHDLDPDYYSFWPNGRHGRRNQIESVAHELAHSLCLGAIMSTAELGRRIARMSDRRADAHELAALRVEAIALRQLGLRVDVVALPGHQAFRGWKPTRDEFLAPLAVAERAVVGWFVSIVREAASAGAKSP